MSSHDSRAIKQPASMVRTVVLIAGLAFAALLGWGIELDPARPQVSWVAGMAAAMAVLWATEIIPLAATALISLVVLPCLGVLTADEVAREFANDTIFLFLGGFLIAAAMERWGLHEQIALRVLRCLGTHPRGLLAGFMVATAGISMWISNTASAMIMVAIAIPILNALEERAEADKFGGTSTAVLLGIAYAASIGGIATLVGTPPNLAFARIYREHFPDEVAVDFVTWFLYGFPIGLMLLIVTGIIIDRLHLKGGQVSFEHKDLTPFQVGPMTWPQYVVFLDFVLLVVLWMTRAAVDLGPFEFPGWARWCRVEGLVGDGTVAIGMSLLLFIIPSGNKSGDRLLDRGCIERLPWHIVLLFGGGFALSAGMNASGFTDWLRDQLSDWQGWPVWIVLPVICLIMSFASEVTSNIAQAQMMLPLLASLASGLAIHPLILMPAATICCSFSFMMPVGTPPNAIVFATQRLKVADMIRTGIWINLCGVVLVTLLSLYWAPLVWRF